MKIEGLAQLWQPSLKGHSEDIAFVVALPILYSFHLSRVSVRTWTPIRCLMVAFSRGEFTVQAITLTPLLFQSRTNCLETIDLWTSTAESPTIHQMTLCSSQGVRTSAALAACWATPVNLGLRVPSVPSYTEDERKYGRVEREHTISGSVDLVNQTLKS